jgi:DNA mismatch repair protein MutL
MQDVIRLLPDALANQIAAGEVVQRPASVVKELLENSVDAGSQQIRLIVKEAGKTWIQVIDDGCGMSETDARMCFERHATSKLRTTEDLFNIYTLGFRGEAMASIAAVAQIEMKTRSEDKENGTLLQIEGSRVLTQEPCVTNKGTNIIVKNLFFNVPARRNFLKTNSVEFRHIIEEFQRVALAYPHVALALYHEDQEIYNLKSGNIAQRIIGIFGKNYKEQILPCSEEMPAVQLKGYIGKPEAAKKTRGEQFFFVNNRFIKNSYLHHAVMTAYEGLLAAETFPFYAIYLDIEPKKIDINVHPTKTEIKFEDERIIYAVIQASVRKALGKNNVKSSLDFDLDANFMLAGRLNVEEYKADEEKNTVENQPHTPSNYQKTSDYVSFVQVSKEQSFLANWEKLYEIEEDTNVDLQALFGEPTHETDQNTTTTLGSKVNQSILEEPNDKKLFQLLNSFIVSQVQSGLLLIDQQFASERILYERFVTDLEERHGLSQQLLFPVRIQLSTADMMLLTELETELLALGFVIEPIDKNTVALKGVPTDLHPIKEQAILEQVLENYKMNKANVNLPKRDKLAIAMAKQASCKRGSPLTNAEMQAIIAQLFACHNANYTPTGQKTFMVLGLDQLDMWLA